MEQKTGNQRYCRKCLTRDMVGKEEYFRSLREYIANLDPEIKADRDGATSLRLGIGLYVPTIKKSKKEPVQGVIAFRKGYYGDSEPVSSQDAHEEKRCP